MINYIRTLVSENKFRFIDRTYNLDLSYITPRIIAMAFPGSGIETLYRNPVDTVVQFLNERHGRDYLIINLSGKTIPKNKFPREVLYCIIHRLLTIAAGLIIMRRRWCFCSKFVKKYTNFYWKKIAMLL